MPGMKRAVSVGSTTSQIATFKLLLNCCRRVIRVPVFVGHFFFGSADHRGVEVQNVVLQQMEERAKR